MLHETLERASRDSRRHRFRFALALLGSALLLALFVLGVIRIDLAQFGFLPERNAPGGEHQPSFPSDAASPAARTAPAPPGAATPPPDPAARDRFMSALGAYERDVEPRIADENFGAWDRALRHQLAGDKAASVQLFADGAYGEAARTLDVTARSAEQALAARDAAFSDSLAAARAAADTDDYDQAARQIAEALRLLPQSSEALALEQRIDRLPPILDLIARASVARIENDLDTEAALLDETVAADPSRTALAERLAAVRGLLDERRFAAQVEAGIAAVERRDPAAARRALKAAEAVFEGRSESKLLAQRIAALERDIDVVRLTRKAEAAADADDWTSAQSHYEAIGKLLPGDQQAAAGAQLARTITDLDARIARHLAAPQRLASSNVADEARRLIAEAQMASALSPRLAGRRAALEAALADYTTEIPVEVVSDGVTYVSVRGVGQVGPTTGRTIALRPGRYTFEGIRAGYKSKLVQVDIPPGATGFVVEVVCDEPV
jgi:hypothetical protein